MSIRKRNRTASTFILIIILVGLLVLPNIGKSTSTSTVLLTSSEVEALPHSFFTVSVEDSNYEGVYHPVPLLATAEIYDVFINEYLWLIVNGHYNNLSGMLPGWGIYQEHDDPNSGVVIFVEIDGKLYYLFCEVNTHTFEDSALPTMAYIVHHGQEPIIKNWLPGNTAVITIERRKVHLRKNLENPARWEYWVEWKD